MLPSPCHLFLVFIIWNPKVTVSASTNLNSHPLPGKMKKVVIDLAATDPEIVPSWANVAGVDSQFLVLSDTNACTAAGTTPPPEIFTFTFDADPPVLMATTAIVPSSFLKAATRSPLPPLVPTRKAPGRT